MKGDTIRPVCAGSQNPVAFRRCIYAALRIKHVRVKYFSPRKIHACAVDNEPLTWMFSGWRKIRHRATGEPRPRYLRAGAADVTIRG